jgi:hypothetical protein
MNRRGAALLVVLAGLIVIMALAATGFALARLRWLESESGRRATAVHLAAAGAVERAVAHWDPVLAETLTTGQAVALGSGAWGTGVSAYDSLLRLGPLLYLVRAVGEQRAADRSLLAREGVARLVLLEGPDVSERQAIMSAGPVRVAGAAAVDGGDRVPPAWSGACPVPSPSAAGIRLAPETTTEIACTSGPCVTGTPAVTPDSQISVTTVLKFGSVSLADLLAGADHHVGGPGLTGRPVEVGGRCDVGDPLNWGDPSMPTGACGRYFPVLAADPDARIIGGIGQGILAASGGIELAGDFAFYGVVVAGGAVTLRDRAQVIGTVIGRDGVTLSDAAMAGRSVCAVSRALSGAIRPSRRLDRGWSLWP